MGTSSNISDLEPSQRLLDPIDRISEVLFGLIMALGFTGTLSAATAGHEEVRTMLIGAIGCNLAWGIVDGVMYLVTELTHRGRGLRLLRAVRAGEDADAAKRVILGVLPGRVAEVMRDEDLEGIRQRLQELPEPAGVRLGREDFLGALGVCLLVFCSTFPVAIPFLLMHDPIPATRVSNLIAVVMLFVCGHRLGKYAGHRPLGMGIAMAVVGGVLVGLTIVLGG